ncbi:MAG: hypothetical protein JXQ89_23420 [Pelagimonas sp.]
MKTTFTALATATVIAVSAVSASAMSNELNSLTGAVYNSLSKMQMDLTGIENLTLKDIQRIQTIMHGGDNENEKRQQINTILRKAGN